ncbi:4-hydroxy-tetrahydrodipicolinate reductase [Tenacibaculum finnmarkense]|uniref:4-hydroxy-tetrahydrodipicolinate reductase n=1 Tax=Tenacibaculum finnmarkense genomovar finnmarkense TaxID=1458503 RepID=A0AAP1RG59_9FLAO|nr:4-hydroxy-tetrahydrodipicolinate reductase [Tenacibaculum finnmarkense]MBE7653036.1 4-hydroxy-tetrahydrodipicolinate reductase [Tenacibaculum finnmarkense genomovar finnmarkense]MBE7695337.1 4-hydroxy-tetrahydrodipicolinate reductase [Tenacibaculum finnmarkense genomovar finnmarkense]MCD8423283.1 4-hydroxy-tetrahydrodipicolinate reductase [Tenacibaculum finnmarkense genomovar ulcerans]MCD8427520.1 4-hydroxy-tetrahydrodipicolinate reductase [Tenacibaculum finnmarkense genomovar finnmarkense]
MKIALLGYGRMGKEIEKIALQRGHEIIIKASGTATYDITKADVAIDFSIPDAAFNNISHCINNQIPVISGTTGWLEKYDSIVELCNQKQGAFIYASNFSLGVNVFFELNKQLAKMMQTLDQYTISIEEIHHTKKLDAPSGTAITLAEGIIENSAKKAWELDAKTSEENIPITAIRTPDVPGTHTTMYDSIVDSIAIKHTAHNRQGFALGAVIAAEWLADKTGVFTMRDVLNLG